MIKKVLSVIIPFLLLTLSSCIGRSANVLIVAGSTSVQPYIEILAEEYERLFPGNHVEIQGGGSSAGITAARAGTADMGMSSRDLKPGELDLWSIEIAKDGLALIIHPRNPVQNLTAEQIRAVYAGEITNWSQIGGNDSRIHVITREEGSGTRSAFEEMVMGDVRITPRAIVQDSNGAIRQLVSGDVNSIGFISLGLVNDNVKALCIDGAEPTFENVMNDIYALYRPFIFITDGEPDGNAVKFIDFILSPAGQRMMMDEGLIPVRPTDSEVRE
jgi:phosphate transport system substrate-binding protein